VAELKIRRREEFAVLLELGGFPEPFLGGSQVEARRWSREYRTRLIQEDIGSLERVEDLGNLELLILRLPELVGSPLSINALREDLQVSHKAVDSWVSILERMYAIFRLSPFGAPKLKAIKKAQKHYHFDWSLVPGMPQRFENLVAAHLLKWVHFEQDTQGRELDVQYFRDVDGREVDFVVTERRKPIMLVECKWSDDEVNGALRYLKHKFPQVAAWQVHAAGKKDYQTTEGIRVAPVLALLTDLV
jgi:predicted AAA+ superfamily ATPase